MLQGLCDSGLVVAGQDSGDAGVPSSDRTQLTSRVNTPVKRAESEICRIGSISGITFLITHQIFSLARDLSKRVT